ncbi:uncharacterized protein [Miscanthus floridulus]|uniref:uncharacterized protein n=1 Tax=Miscanthus floridulus TaxID=154761 RepID=UPI00345944E6
MAEQLEKGNRPNTFSNSVGYVAGEKEFKDRTCIELTKGKIKNKWDKLKEDFKAWKKFKMRQTGTGWNHNNDTIDMDDVWWKKARANIPGYGKLTTCYQGIVNVGANHWFPCGANVAMAAAPTLGSATQESTQDEGAAQAEEGAAQDVAEGKYYVVDASYPNRPGYLAPYKGERLYPSH